MAAAKEAQLRGWLREAIAEKQEAIEAREGLAFDNLKLARRVAELSARLDSAQHRTAASISLNSLLHWGEAAPKEDGSAEELQASLRENESLQAALIDVQRSHACTLRLQNVQQHAEISTLVAEIEHTEADIVRAAEHAACVALEGAEAEKQVNRRHCRVLRGWCVMGP